MTTEEKQRQLAAEESWRSLFDRFVRTRPGADTMMSWLESTDFFVAPASTRFHGDYPGGLAAHSVAVTEALVDLIGAFDDDTDGISIQSAVLVALLHDACKADYYHETTRRAKDAEGKWQDVRAYSVRQDRLPLGHGEKSLYIIRSCMDLTDEEACAIRWHMGAYCDQQQYSEMGVAMDRYPLALLLHEADMIATHMWGK